MRARCALADLAPAVSTAHRAAIVASHSPLETIRIAAVEDGLTLGGQNVTYQVSTQIKAEVAEVGHVQLPARLLHDLLEVISGDDVRLAQEATHLSLTCGAHRFQIRTYDPSYVLDVPDRTDLEIGRVDGAALRRAVDRVRFVCQREPLDPATAGALFERIAGGFRFVATDRIRLAIATVTEAFAPEVAFSVTIPARTLEELSRAPLPAGNEVSLRSNRDRTQVRFSSAGFELVTGVIGQRFPNFERMIPAPGSATISLRIPRNEALEVLRAAALLAGDEHKSVELACRPEDGSVMVSTTGPSGIHRAVVRGSIEGEQTKAEVRGEYLRQGVASIDGDESVIELTRDRACAVRDPAREGDVYVLGVIGSDPKPE